MNEEVELVLGQKMADDAFRRVHAILVMPDGRILTRRKRGEVRLTGGHIDPDDVNVEAALRREVLEEINCKVDRVQYVGYINYYDDEINAPAKMARMVARIAEILPAQPDPDLEQNWTYGRELLPPEIAREQFVQSMPAGNTAELFDECMKVANAHGFFDQPQNTEVEIINEEILEA